VRSEIWGYRDVVLGGIGLVGFDVEATDGPFGKIDDATNEVGGSLLVVDTGSRRFGRKVVLPADVVARVDASNGIVFLDRGRDELKDAPPYRAGRGTRGEEDTLLAASSRGISSARSRDQGQAAEPR
jgi:hypothetical protein